MGTSFNSEEDREQEQEQYRDWLDALSGFVEKALAGVFLFIFKKIPQWFWYSFSTAFAWLFIEVPRKVFEWFRQSADFIFRLGQTTLLLIILISVLIGPPIISLLLHKFLSISLIWSALALIGCAWGLTSLHRQQIRSAIGKLIKKLNFWQNPTSPEVTD